MAENKEDRSSDDLTEEASPYRVEEYRRKGMVAQSREISGMAALLAAGVTAYVLGPRIGTQMAEFMREVFRTDLSSRADLGNTAFLHGLLMKAVNIVLFLGFPICLAGFVVGALGSFLQIGVIFSLDPIQPDFSKIDPISGLKKMFSLRVLTDGTRLIFKMTVVLAIAYGLVKTQVFQAPSHMAAEAGSVLGAFGQVGKVIFLSLIGVLGVFAAIDYGLQRWDFNKGLRMTKQEAKQEHKEREGDPQIKARIRSAQRELARRRMMQAVKTADVIITNPTHIAIAIVYDKNSMAAPRVVAKGADFIAQKIKQVAADAGIPLVENVPLARTLFKSVKIGHSVPRALYQAVAEVLAYVYKLRRKDFT